MVAATHVTARPAPLAAVCQVTTVRHRLRLRTPTQPLPVLGCAPAVRAAPSRNCATAAGPTGDGPGGDDAPLDADEALLMEDLRRYGGGGGGAPGPSGRGPPRPPAPGAPTSQPPASSGLKDALDKALIADFFFILAALAWLVAGVGVSAGGESTVRVLVAASGASASELPSIHTHPPCPSHLPTLPPHARRPSWTHGTACGPWCSSPPSARSWPGR